MLKKIMAIACTLFLLFSMTAFALEADTEIVTKPEIRNGGFESALQAVDWAPIANGSISTEQKHSGEQSLAFPSKTSNTFIKQQYVHYDFIAGRSYTVTGWVKNPQNGNGVFQVNGYTADSPLGTEYYKVYLSGKGVSDWQQLTTTFVPTEGIVKLEIVLGNYTNDAGATTIYFDDITIVEQPLIANGDFENDKPTEGYTDVTAKIARVTGDAANAHSGSAYLKMTKAGGGRYTFAVNVSANTPYKLTYWFKYNYDGGSTGGGYPKVGVGATVWDTNPILDDSTSATFHNTIGSNTLLNLGADQWVKRTHYFTTPADTTKIYIKLFSPGSNQTCYYDDFELEVDKTGVALQNYSGANGEDVTNLSALAEEAPLYAKARFIPETDVASAMLVAAVFDETGGTKMLEYVDIVPYSTTTGEAKTLETTISGYASFAGKAVEVYLWDSTTGLHNLTNKLRRSQSAAQ